MPSLATWFSPSLQTISRSAGRSSVLAAAYRACMELTDERLGITRDFTPKGKHGLAGNFCIGIPNDDIGELFNNAEKAETRANSTVARELMVPLPSGWTDDERAQCARGLGEMLRARYGVAVLVSIHRPSKDNNNDHAHILFTTRTVDADGVFGKKTRILDDAKTGEVKKLREPVCELVNIQAREQGEDWYVYAGKFSNVVTDHIPTTHISVAHGKKQKAYIDANREEVGQARVVLGTIQAREKAITAQIASLTSEATTAESSQDAPPKPRKVDKVVTAPDVAEPALRRIEMPGDAVKARDQLEAALHKRRTLRQHHTAWQEMHAGLLAKPPTPEFWLFGWRKASYKKALAEHAEELQTAADGMAECSERARTLIDFIKDPERQRLNSLYNETFAHNARVDAHEKQLAQQRERERVQLVQEQAQRDQDANRVDWAAYMNAPTVPSQATSTEYSSGGHGM
jgi:hypothetical protein